MLAQVAERALFLWRNEYIVTLIAQNRTVILPIIFSSLERNSRDHWNQTVHGLTNNVRRMFMELDNTLFQVKNLEIYIYIFKKKQTFAKGKLDRRRCDDDV